MNFFKHIINWLFFKFCFTESKLSNLFITYYVPNTLRTLNGTKVDGKLLFGRINTLSNFTDCVDSSVPICSILPIHDEKINNKRKIR